MNSTLIKYTKTTKLVLFSMFTAIIFILAFTPIGFINLGFIKATIVHIPVIIGSILLGPIIGAGLGAIFGLSSLISNTTTPVVSSFVFSPFVPAPGQQMGSLWALFICFVPRILVGVLPWAIYRLGQFLIKNKTSYILLTVSGVLGSLTNTFLVMNLIYFFFKDEYAYVRGVAIEGVYDIVKIIMIANGIPEAMIAGILTTIICKTLFIALSRKQ